MRFHPVFVVSALALGLLPGFGESLKAEKPGTPKPSPEEEVEKKPAGKSADIPEAKEPVRSKKPREGKRKPEAKKDEASKSDAASDKVAEKEAEKKEAPDSKGETHRVEAKPFKITAKMPGVIEARKQTPVSMDLERWSEMTVVEVVPHGSVVKKGDVLIELETDALEKKIRELKAAMPLKELDLHTAELELEKLETTTPLSLEQTARYLEQAEQDLDYFLDVSRPMRERDAKEDVKATKNYLSYAEEELRQLKKMYEEDDLTEETEEIILQRAQNSVDQYKWMLTQTEQRSDRTLSTSLPREEISLKRNLEMKQIDAEASEASKQGALERKRLDVEAKVRSFEETQRELEEYESDLEAMNLTAPHDGVVYYGMSQRGKWTTAATVGRKLIPGGKLSMREIVMTVVDPSDVNLRLSVPENKLMGLKKGLKGDVELEWDPDAELSGTLESVLFVPFADNTYDAVVRIPNPGKARVVTGMKGEIELVVYEKENALTVPKKAVKKEGRAETVTLKNGEIRKVRTGRSDGDEVEVVQGLKSGDEILLEDKKEEKAEGDSTEDKKEAKPDASKAGEKK